MQDLAVILKLHYLLSLDKALDFFYRFKIFVKASLLS